MHTYFQQCLLKHITGSKFKLFLYLVFWRFIYVENIGIILHINVFIKEKDILYL